MTENVFTSHTEPQPEPTLRRNLELPKGVLQKNLKTFVYLGAALLVIVAALFSSSGKKTPGQQASVKGEPPQPTLQDNTDSNVQELKNQLQAERQKEQQATMVAAALGDPALASATPQQRCDALTATASPTIDALGVRMCIALATIMLVWFGVQESLASTHGGQGFHMGKFLSFFVLITFAYTLVRFYDSSIPGVGQSFRGFVNGGAQYLVSVIGSDSITSIQNTLNQAQATSGPGMVKALMNPYYAIVYVIIQVLIATFSAAVSAIVAYGAIASAVVGLLGPVFIPFLVFDKLEFLFWGWLRAFIGFCFYKVLAAAVLSILAHLLAQYYTELVNFSDPGNMVQELPLLILLVLVNIYILFKIPAMTMSIFSGSSGGHGGGMGGMITAAILRAI